MEKDKSTMNPSPQSYAAMKAAELREQQGKQALKKGDTTFAQEHFYKAAGNYMKAGALEGSVRCLAECDKLTISIGQLLRIFDPGKVFGTVKKHLGTDIGLGLCLLAAANTTGNAKYFSSTEMLLQCASKESPKKAVFALKGAAVAASWENKHETALYIATELYSLLRKCHDDGGQTVDEKGIVLDSIITLQTKAAITDDISLFQEIDRLQMRYVRLAGGRTDGDVFIRSLFPMFLARGQDLNELIALADDSPTLRPYVDVYGIFLEKSNIGDFEAVIRNFEEKIGHLENRPDHTNSLTTWLNVAHRFYNAGYFMPERLSVRIIRQQYCKLSKNLEQLSKIIFTAVDCFIKKEYKKSLEAFSDAMEADAFSSLPRDAQMRMFENAARAAFELEDWEKFDNLCSRLEDRYGAENVVQTIIEE